MSFFHVWICILGTIYVIDKLIDTMLNIVIYSDSKMKTQLYPNMRNQCIVNYFFMFIFMLFAFMCIVNVA